MIILLLLQQTLVLEAATSRCSMLFGSEEEDSVIIFSSNIDTVFGFIVVMFLMHVVLVLRKWYIMAFYRIQKLRCVLIELETGDLIGTFEGHKRYCMELFPGQF